MFQLDLYFWCHNLVILWGIICRSGSWTGGHGGWVELSGKMQVLARLLAQLRQRTNDRIVLVSNYTQACGSKKSYVLELFFNSRFRLVANQHNCLMELAEEV